VVHRQPAADASPITSIGARRRRCDSEFRLADLLAERCEHCPGCAAPLVQQGTRILAAEVADAAQARLRSALASLEAGADALELLPHTLIRNLLPPYARPHGGGDGESIRRLIDYLSRLIERLRAGRGDSTTVSAKSGAPPEPTQRSTVRTLPAATPVDG
jgi:hypothetical protein